MREGQPAGQQRLDPMLRLSYSTRLLSMPQPSSHAPPVAWFPARFSNGTIPPQARTVLG